MRDHACVLWQSACPMWDIGVALTLYLLMQGKCEENKIGKRKDAFSIFRSLKKKVTQFCVLPVSQACISGLEF
jgi:hypothetical protein